MTESEHSPDNDNNIVIFPTTLGWMTLTTRAGGVEELRFGHKPASAVHAAGKANITGPSTLSGNHSLTLVQSSSQPDEWVVSLVELLQSYATITRSL